MRLVTFILLLLFSTQLFSQNPVWQSIGISDGLSQGMVFDMLQDRHGFIWIATKDGLNRYDGYNFKVFTNDPYNQFSISGNTCTALLEDTRGRLWIGTEKDGLNLFDPKTNRFYHAKITDSNKNDGGNYGIFSLKEDTDGQIWVITNTPEKVFKVKLAETYPPKADFISWIHAANLTNTVPYFRFDERYLRSQQSYQLFRQYPFHPDSSKIETRKSIVGQMISQDKNGNFWVFYPDKIVFYGKNQQKTIPANLGDMLSVNQFKDGTMAFSNKYFLWVFQPDELLKQNQLNADNAYSTVPNERLTDRIIKDQSGVIWMGTSGFGLLKFNPLSKQFKSYLASHSPSMLLEDHANNVYLHANFNPAFQYFRLNTRSNQLEKLPIELADARTIHYCLFQDAKKQFWLIHGQIGSPKRFLGKYSPDWQLLKQYQIPVDNGGGSDFRSIIHEDEFSNLWLGVPNGLLFGFATHTEQFKRYDYRAIVHKSGSITEVFAMYQDLQKNLWIGTQKGLIKVENLPKNPQFKLLKNSVSDRKSLSNDFVSGMIDDPIAPQKYLWVSTKGGGLERLDKQNNTFEHFDEKNGLPNKVVYGIVLGDDKNLWMSTNRGLSRLNPKTLIFNNFNKSDGLQDDEFNTNSYHRGKSGNLYFGGVNGVNIFKASAIQQDKKQPIAKIIGLKVNNETIEPNEQSKIAKEAVEYLSELHLAHDQNLVTIEFGLMDFANPVKNRFRYQLEGIDSKWIESGTNRFANYTHLSAGSYTFKVMGTTNGEVWSQPIELKINIRPPWYRTWWAYLLYLSVLTYIAYRFYQFQINRVRLSQALVFNQKEKERLAELDQLKTNFFANISHEFRTPLTLILGPAQDLVKQNPDENTYQIIYRNATRLLQLINQLLDLSKLEAKQMQVETTPTDLPKFFRTLVSAFASLAESKNIRFQFEQSPGEVYGLLDQDKAEKILTNLLSNAFKFTPSGGQVRVSIAYNEQIKIEIKDSGIGIEKGKLAKIFDRFYQVDGGSNRHFEGTGIGLALVKELVDVLNGTIRVESEVGVGTTFFVTLPTPRMDVPPTSPLTHTIDSVSHSVVSIPTDQIIPPLGQAADASRGLGLDNVLLIVDDNADIRAYIRSIFEADYHTIEAVNGKDGLTKAFETIPNLIISDLMMPEMDGFEFCQTLKTDERTSHIPVVMLTAKANVESRIEGFELGADEYLVKPFHTNEIKTRIRNLLEKQQKLQAFFSQKVVQIRAEAVPSPSVEDKFAIKVREIVERHLSNSGFSVEQFCAEMGMSQSQLLRKIKAISNMTVVEFVRDYRLQRATEMLTQHQGGVSEVAFAVGFESLSYFTRAFQDKYGKLPSEL